VEPDRLAVFLQGLERVHGEVSAPWCLRDVSRRRPTPAVVSKRNISRSVGGLASVLKKDMATAATRRNAALPMVGFTGRASACPLAGDCYLRRRCRAVGIE